MNSLTAPTAALLSSLPEQSSSTIGAGDSNDPSKKPAERKSKLQRYDSNFMLKLRFVPLSTMPPDNLPFIPQVTFPPRPHQTSPQQLPVPQMPTLQMPMGQMPTAQMIAVQMPAPKMHVPQMPMPKMPMLQIPAQHVRMHHMHLPMHYPDVPAPPFYQEYPYKRIILKNIHNGIMTVYDTEHPNGSDTYSYI